MNRVKQMFPIAVAGFLAISPLAAQARNVVYNSLGGTENGGDSFKTGGPVLVDEIKVAQTGTLGVVILNVAKTSSTVGEFKVVLTKIAASGKPKLRTVIRVFSDATLTSSFQLIHARPHSPITLEAGMTYYVGIERNRGLPSSVVLGNTVDPKVLSRPTVQAGGFYYNSGGVQPNAGGPYEILVSEAP